MTGAFGEDSDYWYDVIGATIMCVAVISLLGNLAILVLYKRVFKRRRSRLININLISLTCADIGICISFPFVFDACFHRGWHLGSKACTSIAFSDAIFAYSQIYNLTLIALERVFISVKAQLVVPSLKKKIYSILIVWILAISMASLPHVGFGDFMLDGINVSCTFDYHSTSIKNVAYINFIVIFGFVLPVVIICICYYKIIQTNKQSGFKLNESLAVQHSQNAVRKREILLLKSTSKAVISFVLAWTPYASIALASVFGYKTSSIIETLSSIFAKTSSATNAIVYICNHPEFKDFKRNVDTEVNIQNEEQEERAENHLLSTV